MSVLTKLNFLVITIIHYVLFFLAGLWEKLLRERRCNTEQISGISNLIKHHKRKRMLGKAIAFFLGFWAGAFANQRYRMPSACPREVWEEMKTAAEGIRREYPNIPDSPEFKEIVEKLRQLEKRYRRPQTSDDSQPSTSGSSSSPSAPQTTEWISKTLQECVTVVSDSINKMKFKCRDDIEVLKF